MLTVKELIRARKTCYGQYDFQYPDKDTEGIILKPGSKIDLLSWISNDKLRAAMYFDDSRSMIVWVDPRDVGEKCDQGP